MDDELAAVLLERPLQLVRVGRDRTRVVHDRPQPEQEQRRRNDERPERQQAGAHVRPLPQSAHDEEADERDPEEDRVRRMHDCEHESRGCRRGEEPERRQPHGLERERERRRHEQLPRRRRGEREKDVRPAHARREGDHRHLRGRRHAGGPRPPEERPAGLERDENGERREDRRQVGDDALGILAGDLRDQPDEAVPERERVAGVQAAVGELGDPLERQVVELEQLPHTGEVEQTVSLHGRSGDPEEHADDGPPEERPRARGISCASGQRRNRRSTLSARATRTSSASARVSVEPSANVSASAPNTTTRDQARLADALRTPSVRATSQPGARTTAVANASLT